MLILARSKTMGWQRSIYASIGVNGFSALGYAAPFIYPYPSITFIVATSIMLAGVAWSYYIEPGRIGSIDEKNLISGQRTKAVKYTVYGLILTIGFSVVIGFTQGQERGNDVQESFTGAVVRLSDEIRNLGKLVNGFDKRLQIVERQMQGQNLFQDSVLSNQKKVLKNQGDAKKDLKKRK